MKKYIKVILPLLLVTSIIVSGSFALLSAKSKTIVNAFEYVYNELEVRELNFIPTEYSFSPNEPISKDPAVYNIGGMESYVYMSVFNPGQYFSYTVDGDNWDILTVVNNDTREIDGEQVSGQTRFYSYKKPLAPGESTTPLFSTIQLKAYDYDKENELEDLEKEGEGSGSSLTGKIHNVQIEAYGATTDIDDYIREDCVMRDSKKLYSYICVGRDNAWWYLCNDIAENTPDGEDPPVFVNIEVNDVYEYEIQLLDYEGNYYGDIYLAAYGKDNLDYISVNKIIELASADNGVDLPLFVNDKHLYAAQTGDYSTNIFPEDGSLSMAMIDAIYINNNYGSVYLDCYEGELEAGVVELNFEPGTTITTQAINDKLVESGYEFSVAEDPTFSETATIGEPIFMTVQLSEE